MKLPDYISNHKFHWDIVGADDTRDFRNVFKDMEDLKSWKKDPPGGQFNEIVKYILFMYDKGTPFTRKFNDLNKRKEAAVKFSGLEGKVKTEMLNLSNDHHVDMIVDFLMLQGDKLWAVICIHENLFAEYSGVLLKNIELINNDKDLVAGTNLKEKTRESLIKVQVELESLYNKFYNHDVELQETVQKKVRMTPEMISKMK